MLQIKVPFLPMSAWLPKVVEPSKQQGLAAVFFLILYPYYLIRDSLSENLSTKSATQSLSGDLITLKLLDSRQFRLLLS